MIPRLLRTASVCAVLVLATACESTPPAPIHRQNLQEVRATVVDVQKPDRLVSLKTPDGGIVTAVMGPEVRNFDQIHVGDTVVASYYEEVSFEVRDPKLATERGVAAVGAGRAPLGAMPAGVVDAFAQTTVTFQSYDADNRIVTFTDENGRARAATVQRADGHEFAKQLNRGDRVVISMAKTVAVRVDAGR